MEFNEDPFKDANHRYGDPFDLEGADPFKNEQDPFTASVDDAFGTLPRKSQKNEAKDSAWPNDAWASSGTAQADPFMMLSGTVKTNPAPSNNLDDSFDPFSAKNLVKAQDPFSSVKAANSDPFGSPLAKPSAKASAEVDPFGSSSAWSAASDPFSAAPVTRSKTSIDPFSSSKVPNKSLNPLQKSETTSKVSQSLSRPWSSKDDPFHASSIPRSRPTSSKSSDPFSVAPALDLSSVSHEKKEKKNNFKLGHLNPLRTKKDKKDKSGHKMIRNDLSSPSAPPPVEEAHVRMASEASKKAEEERLQRLRQQEEQDLAYAIALSKAEAASLQNQ